VRCAPTKAVINPQAGAPDAARSVISREAALLVSPQSRGDDGFLIEAIAPQSILPSVPPRIAAGTSTLAGRRLEIEPS